ncbi:MAG: FG-GAP repeat domain-containing protein [Kofleriaceae bacterium]
MRALLALALVSAGCSKLLGITDPSAGAGDGGTDAPDGSGPTDGDVDAPPPCTSSPSFGPPRRFDIGATGTGLAVQRLDRAVGFDAAVAVGDRVVILRGDGAGNFAVSQTVPVPATDLHADDFDGDSDMDLVAWTAGGTEVVAVRQDSTTNPSSFLDAQPLQGPFSNLRRIAVEHLDGNFRPDLLIEDDLARRVYTANVGTPGTFSRSSTTVGAVDDQLLALQQIDQELRADVALVGPSGVVKLARSNVTGFAAPTQIATGAVGVAGAFGGLTGNALPDLVLATAAGGVIYQQQQPGMFTRLAGTLPGITGSLVRVVDVNGDGADDLVMADRVALQCPSARGTFSQIEPLSFAQPAVLVDVTEDGKLDLLRIEGNQLVVQIQ